MVITNVQYVVSAQIDKYSIVSVIETHCLDVVDNIAVMTIDLLRKLGLFFLICLTPEEERVLVDIHTNLDCAILHLMISICMW